MIQVIIHYSEYCMPFLLIDHPKSSVVHLLNRTPKTAVSSVSSKDALECGPSRPRSKEMTISDWLMEGED